MDYKAINDGLTRMVRPSTSPVGIKIIENTEAFPENAIRPSKFGIKISLCQWTTMARRWGRVYGAVAEDINCSPCLAALGLKKMESESILADYFMEMTYFANPEHAAAAVKKLGIIPPGRIRGIVAYPLADAPTDPDVVLIYGTPAQTARLTAGYVYHGGELIESVTTGFGISCLSALKPFFTDKPALVHPGRGERILAGTDESEMIFTMPTKYLPQLLDGLEKTHEKGSRYPIQKYLIYQPPQVPPVKALGDKLTEL